MKKIGFISLGCPKNLVDSEVMMGQLKQNGFEITSDASQADTVSNLLAVLLNRPRKSQLKQF